MTAETLTTVHDAAEQFDVPSIEIYRRIDAGELYAAKNDRGRVVVRVSDVERLIRS